MPLRALLDQFAPDFPGFCKVGKGHNQKIDFDAWGFIAVVPSVQHLVDLKFDAVFVDEAHHPLPSRMPKYEELYRFSATHTEEPDFRYTMGQAIQDGVLCDYDITVPVVSEHHAYVCLADLLLKQAGRFRRVLAYCNTVPDAKKFQAVLEEFGLAAWHINARTSHEARVKAIEDFSGTLQKPVHALVTVEVLGEGINIPNADTCMFVEPRNSYRSVIQAIGRVLRNHPGKTLAHIVLPAVAVPANVGSQAFSSDPASLEMVEAAGIVQGHAATHTEHEGPEQELTTFGQAVADTPARSAGETMSACNTGTCWTTRSTTSRRGIDAVDASTQDDRAGPPTLYRGSERGVSNAEEQQTHQEEPDHRAVGIMGRARQEGIGNVSFNLAPSSVSTQTSSASSAASMSVPSASPAPFPSHALARSGENRHSQKANVDLSPMPQILSASRRVGEGRSISPGYLAGDGHSGEENHCDHSQGEHGADQVCNGHAAIKEALQQDAALWEDCNDALRSSPVEAQQRGGAGPPIRRVQLKSSLNPSDPNELHGSQLERFLSLLVQADSRLVGSSVGHRIQLVDCRTTVVEGQELDSLTQAVYRQLTAILRQRDLWEDTLQSLEAFVHEKGRLPLRKVRDEKSLACWLNTQRARLRAGLLLEHKWWRLVRSSLPLIRQRAQGWLSGDRDGAFQRGCLELKAYLETHGKLPHFSRKAPRTSQRNRLALWLSSLREREGWTKPERRTKLESLHPLVLELLANWSAPTSRIDLPIWQRMVHRLVVCVQANGHLPRSGSADKELYDWLYRNLRRLERLPQELVKQLLDSHPLIAAKVRAAQALHVGRTGLKRSSQGFMGRTFDPTAVRCGGYGDSRIAHPYNFAMPLVVVSTCFLSAVLKPRCRLSGIGPMRPRRLHGLAWLVLGAWAGHVLALLPAPWAAPRRWHGCRRGVGCRDGL